jgi:hypothetical protein
LNINIVIPLLEYFDIDYIENTCLLDILLFLDSVNNKELIRASAEWFIQQELEIDREIKNVKEGLQPRSVEFQRMQLRKKRFKGYGMD